MLIKRQLMIALLSAGALVLSGWTTEEASDNTAWNGLLEGVIALFRHANAPGGGDPPGLSIAQRSVTSTKLAASRRSASAWLSR
jgi:hypothetical protein